MENRNLRSDLCRCQRGLLRLWVACVPRLSRTTDRLVWKTSRRPREAPLCGHTADRSSVLALWFGPSCSDLVVLARWLWVGAAEERVGPRTRLPMVRVTGTLDKEG